MVTKNVEPTRGREGRKPFMINSVLLSLIDPVRGEPTKSLLDGNPDDDVSRSHQLKEKFLDSFALICSTSSSGSVTASAVCMEQNQSFENTLRVARNHSFSPQNIDSLRKILQILTAVANRDKLPGQAESEALREIADLDQDRIRSFVTKLEKSGIQTIFKQAISNLFGSERNEEILEYPRFRQWIKTCPFMSASLSSSETARLVSYIMWASQARWTYPKHLKALLAFGSEPLPPWMETLHKLARYWAAVKSMVKLAVKQPRVFANIQIQEIKAPEQESFRLSPKEMHLREALQRLVKNDCRTTMDKLAQRWKTNDVEGKLRDKCKVNLTLHAEMQLVGFYERNPDLVPQLRLMGTSKKACFLCHEFLLRHPLGIRVSACHQKVYPTWMPPPSHNVPGTPRNKLFWDFSKHIERVTVKALKTELSARQRPKTRDSTAGGSLTETATIPTEFLVRQHLLFDRDGI
ncbi:hypothetical protein PFICI_13887 [Pestalotiopsis fici W106-1]|uniref:Uncharacterized protein n=1 Tax=Pestalotiopsis fici (strain W106-1 / CGMCC3.15140) TaxID=1229662 RepID=W3WMH5_PESFW|nr:uncharacterized protein PFICI_13887 [Pestalotiopsis fici W106-1]ETS74021.1 hypothetical protein PFICI_13887 [Pestalotiopsis fici W106-1]